MGGKDSREPSSVSCEKASPQSARQSKTSLSLPDDLALVGRKACGVACSLSQVPSCHLLAEKALLLIGIASPLRECNSALDRLVKQRP